MNEDIQAYIYEHIPIVEKNQFTIEGDEAPYIRVKAHLADHVNHRKTAFGGSISTSLILCSWASVRSILKARGIDDGGIVIQTQRVDFSKPVTGDFSARVVPLREETVNRFIAMLEKFGKGRLKVEARVTQGSDTASLAHFIGEFVVIRES